VVSSCLAGFQCLVTLLVEGSESGAGGGVISIWARGGYVSGAGSRWIGFG